MMELGLTLKTETPHQSINNISRPDQSNNRIDADIAILKGKFHNFFTENHTVKNVEVDIQLKEGSKLIQQKGRPIPIHLQPAVEKENEKLKKQGHIEKAKNIDKNCFVSSAVITTKKNKSVKNSPGFKKIEQNYEKKKGTNAKHGGIIVPNLQKHSGRTSRRNLNLKIRHRLRVQSTKTLKESNGPMHICGNRWQLHRILPVPKRFLRAGRHPHDFSRKKLNKHWKTNTQRG